MKFLFSAEFFKRVITSGVLGACLGGAYLHSILLFNLTLLIILFIIITFEWSNLMPLQPLQFFLVTLCYPTIPMVSLMYLNYSFHDINLLVPLFPVLLAWTADTCGYLVGKSIGHHKMCPSISPGKTWEGFIGSCVGVGVLSLAMIPHLEGSPFITLARMSPVIRYPLLIAFTIVATGIAFLGGIFISMLKRKQGLKDAGHVLPGHGGFLDRFDSVFFTVPFIALIIFILN